MTTQLPTPLSFPRQLNQMQTKMKTLAQVQPDIMQAFSKLHSAGTSSGALDAKTKELIALAIAVNARCDGCIAFHTHDALKAGASPEEISDALGVAILMGGGPSVVYATHVLQAMDEFSATDGVGE